MLSVKNLSAVLYSCIACLLFSCSVLEPALPTASYIRIDSIPVTSDYATEGSNSNRVTDAWVIYDNEFLGTFPLPAEIPLIGTGDHKIIVRAGIIENGISGTRSAYPKYESYDTTVNLTANQKTVITPVVRYQPGLGFPQIEDFDDASLSLVSTNTNYAELDITAAGDANAFEGNSGKVTLDANHPIFEAASSQPFTLPLSVPTYVELNYKCDNEFRIGMFISTQSGVVQSELLTIKKSSEWKKIYISISDLGGVQQSAIDYTFYIRADKSSSLVSGDLYFDNLKVIY